MNYIITNSGNITIVIRGFRYAVCPDHPRYENIIKMLRDPTTKEDILIEYVDFAEACEEYGVSVAGKSGGVYVDGKFLEGGQEALDAGVSLGNIALRKHMEDVEL